MHNFLSQSLQKLARRGGQQEWLQLLTVSSSDSPPRPRFEQSLQELEKVGFAQPPPLGTGGSTGAGAVLRLTGLLKERQRETTRLHGELAVARRQLQVTHEGGDIRQFTSKWI